MSKASERAKALVAAATEGPWVGSRSDSVVLKETADGSMRLVAGVHTTDDVAANVALIAEAPTLLVELARQVEHFERCLMRSASLALAEVTNEVWMEIGRADEAHGPAYASMHEAYAVLFEEVAEFFDEVRLKQSERDPARLRAELVQVAAVAIRAARQLGGDR